MVTVAELKELSRPDTWPNIERLLSAGGQPKLDNLLKALDQEKAIPPLAKTYIATLLGRRIKKRTGRRAVPLGEYPVMHEIQKEQRKNYEEILLVYLVRDIAKELSAEKDPTQAAIEKIALDRNVDASTLRRYFMKARARWPEGVQNAPKKK